MGSVGHGLVYRRGWKLKLRIEFGGSAFFLWISERVIIEEHF